jgi:hypothetical protein
LTIRWDIMPAEESFDVSETGTFVALRACVGRGFRPGPPIDQRVSSGPVGERQVLEEAIGAAWHCGQRVSALR